jgi:hypothetical protein
LTTDAPSATRALRRSSSFVQVQGLFLESTIYPGAFRENYLIFGRHLTDAEAFRLFIVRSRKFMARRNGNDKSRFELRKQRTSWVAMQAVDCCACA